LAARTEKHGRFRDPIRGIPPAAMRVMRFLPLAGLALAACSPAWTADDSGGATSLTFDVTIVHQPVDGQCMPNLLTPNADCSVTCAALVITPGVEQAFACTLAGTSQPDAATLARFETTWRETHPTGAIPAACAVPAAHDVRLVRFIHGRRLVLRRARAEWMPVRHRIGAGGPPQRHTRPLRLFALSARSVRLETWASSGATDTAFRVSASSHRASLDL
jgi:hypothetical protein